MFYLFDWGILSLVICTDEAVVIQHTADEKNYKWYKMQSSEHTQILNH